MKKALILRILDFIPLFILIGFAIHLVVVVATGQIVFQNEHYAGLGLLLVTTIMFFVNHKLGVVCLGLTLLVGLIGFASLSWAVAWSSIYIGSLKISFAPDFLLWAVIHAILSGRHYVGIATGEYWEEIFDKGKSDHLKIDD